MPKANAKNRIIKKQQKTDAIIQDVPYEYQDGEQGVVQVHVPDNEYAYGSNERTMQLIVEDVVGKHSGDNAKAVSAGEDARRQVNQRASFERAKAKVAARTRGVKYEEVRDNTGSLIGVNIHVSRQDPATGMWSIKSYGYDY